MDELEERVQLRDQERQRQLHDLQELTDLPHLQERRDHPVGEPRAELVHQVVTISEHVHGGQERRQ